MVKMMLTFFAFFLIISQPSQEIKATKVQRVAESEINTEDCKRTLFTEAGGDDSC